MNKYCVFDENKVCDECGDCVCDLDPNKICDNCMKCLHTDADYSAIQIDKIVVDGIDEEVYRQVLNDLTNLDEENPFDCFKPKQYTPKH